MRDQGSLSACRFGAAFIGLSCCVLGAPRIVVAETLHAEPAFVPGLYATESRNSAFQREHIKSKTCIRSADFEAFLRETIAQYAATPQFKAVCKLSESKRLADGFAFAMDCGASRTIIRYHFEKDFFTSTTETKILARPDYSSSILTLARRVGPCDSEPPPAGPH